MKRYMLRKRYEIPKPRELRSFGVIWSIFFIIIALYPLFRGQHIRYWPVPLSVLSLVIGFIVPNLLTKFYIIWLKFGNIIGNIISKIILFFIFYLLITPIGMILKISGKDLLNKKTDKNQPTYWIKRETQPTSLKNQF